MRPWARQLQLAMCVTLLVTGIAATTACNDAAWNVRLVTDDADRLVVEVNDIPAAWLEAMHRVAGDLEWAEILSVYVANPDDAGASDVPMLGRGELSEDAVRFVPRFPLRPGFIYRVELNVARLGLEIGRADDAGKMIVALVESPRAAPQPPTTLTGIYPSADVLPENLLKFYLTFSAPMGRGAAYQHITLLDGDEPVVLPFLELAEELWDPGMTRLTLFIDPGRIKRGVTPHEEVGLALLQGHRYQLVVDPAWTDARGRSLGNIRLKTFQVGPSDFDPIDLATWAIDPPESGSRDPLVITFPESLDYGLLHRVLTIVDRTDEVISGEVTLRDHETRWIFTPARPWAAGEHTLLVDRVLEDLAGNSVGRAFEVPIVDAAADIGDHRPVRRVKIPFRVQEPS